MLTGQEATSLLTRVLASRNLDMNGTPFSNQSNNPLPSLPSISSINIPLSSRPPPSIKKEAGKKKTLSITITDAQLEIIQDAKKHFDIQSNCDANIIKAIINELPCLINETLRQSEELEELKRDQLQWKKRMEEVEKKLASCKEPLVRGGKNGSVKRKKPYDEKTSLTSKYEELDDVLVYLSQRRIPLEDLSQREQFLKRQKEKDNQREEDYRMGGEEYLRGIQRGLVSVTNDFMVDQVRDDHDLGHSVDVDLLTDHRTHEYNS
eukprot:TRINITY_DN2109_c0_g1_i1.p1 TRINITY_DN2109_c0_g1~~TRINITY_DN2109_c0_g1_i1.p1  ORF type:complete len:264 (-),score=106.15 TRINITY_DN2109_c0_g1_i1:28-819(-)